MIEINLVLFPADFCCVTRVHCLLTVLIRKKNPSETLPVGSRHMENKQNKCHILKLCTC